MSRIIVAALISLVAGFALGAWVITGEFESDARPLEGRAAEGADRSATLTERLLSLEQVIAEEREARLGLESQVDSLIEAIERISSGGSVDTASQVTRTEPSRESRRSENRRQRDFAAMIKNYQDRRVSKLVDGGFAEDEARRLLRQESEAQFKALQASYDAKRAGEPVDPFRAINDPQSILRAEIGDGAYERYLAAQDQPTSIQVTQVLAGSPGSRAGLQSGDQIVNYNGERVFNVNELRNLTMQGAPGEDVIVEIERDGVRMQLGLRSGPIGITGNGSNVRGTNWWGGS